MTSSTQPNHATFTTGAPPSDHGVVANSVFVDHGSITPTPAVTTIFEAVRSGGLRSEAILGDADAVISSGATHADLYWPHGPLPDSVPVDAFGHADDDTGTAHILAALDRKPDLLFGRLNQVDTHCHRHGPDSAEALTAIRRADDHLATIVEHLQPAWEETLLIVLSDHDQESADKPEPIDLTARAADAGFKLEMLSEGAAALVRSPAQPLDIPWLLATPGVGGVAPANAADGESTALVWSDPGHWFGEPGHPYLRGVHGSPRTRTQVAIASGGHPDTRQLADEIAQQPPEATFWAPYIARTLHVLDPRSITPLTSNAVAPVVGDHDAR